LIALPVLLRVFVYPTHPARTVSAIIGLAEVAYRKGCLSGFGRCEDCTIAVGERVLVVLSEDLTLGRVDPVLQKEAQVVLKWLGGEVALASAEAAQH